MHGNYTIISGPGAYATFRSSHIIRIFRALPGITAGVSAQSRKMAVLGEYGTQGIYQAEVAASGRMRLTKSDVFDMRELHFPVPSVSLIAF